MDTKYSKEMVNKIKDMPSADEMFNKSFADKLIKYMNDQGICELYLQGKITFDINERFNSDTQTVERITNFRPTDWRDK